MKFVIKERHNPQSGVYYVAAGRQSNRYAKARKALYGTNIMHAFDTEAEYEAAKAKIVADGGRFI